MFSAGLISLFNCILKSFVLASVCVYDLKWIPTLCVFVWLDLYSRQKYLTSNLFFKIWFQNGVLIFGVLKLDSLRAI